MKKKHRPKKESAVPQPAPGEASEPAAPAAATEIPAAASSSPLRRSPWIWFAAFALLWLAPRVFWLDADPGIPSQWEYGYNATDEGYYLDGGKEKLLWGTFTDLARTEAFTYGFSSGTHFLSYLAHLCFGLSTWTWRLPFFLIAFAAWCATFLHAAKRRGGAFALLSCGAVATVPMVVAYERTASNDVLIGSLAALALAVASGKGRWRVFASAALAAAVVLVKPSVWLILPLVLSGVLSERKFKSAWIDAAAFLAAAVAGVFLFRLAAALAVLPDAAREGCSVFEIVRRTTTHYPLPSPFAFADHFRGLSAFPRDPSCTMLGFLAVLLVPVPLLLLLVEAVHARKPSRMLLFASVPAYVGAVSVMNTIYTHYFIPVVMALPFVVCEAADCLRDAAERDGDAPDAPALRRFCAVAAFLAFLALLLLAEFRIPRETVGTVYSKIYNFPQTNVWSATWGVALILVAGGLAVAAAFGGRRRWRTIAVCALPLAAAASVVCARLPAVSVAPFLKADPALYLRPLLVDFVAGFGLVLLMALFPRVSGRGRLLPASLAALAAASYLLCPAWRTAAAELAAPGTHRQREVAEELRAILPPDAIVVGERSNQLLMPLPIRTATTFASNSDPIPVVRRIAERYPDAPLFALADSQHAYNLQHYREHADECRLELVRTFQLPSFGTGQPSDVYLCRIRRPADSGPSPR